MLTWLKTVEGVQHRCWFFGDRLGKLTGSVGRETDRLPTEEAVITFFHDTFLSEEEHIFYVLMKELYNVTVVRMMFLLFWVLMPCGFISR
jgi:hypothetical protein